MMTMSVNATTSQKSCQKSDSISLVLAACVARKDVQMGVSGVGVQSTTILTLEATSAIQLVARGHWIPGIQGIPKTTNFTATNACMPD